MTDIENTRQAAYLSTGSLIRKGAQLSFYGSSMVNTRGKPAAPMGGIVLPAFRAWQSFPSICGSSKRVRGTILHVRLRDGKVWIEEDLTEDGIATYLLAAEVPKSDIVLAFQSPETGKFTEFAVA